jgi:uracil-DNA glycosylase
MASRLAFSNFNCDEFKALHHKGSREVLKHTKQYFDMIFTLLESGCRVYLTDIYKIWVCDPNARYHRIKLPPADQKQFLNSLVSELAIINPLVVVTWGEESKSAVAAIDL